MLQVSSSPRFHVWLSKPELIKPETTTPREKKPLAEVDSQPELRYQMPALWFYENKASMDMIHPAKVIKEGLAKALVFFYPLAGRLFEGPNKNLIVDCNGEGVMFVRGEANITLEDLGDSILSPCPYLEKLLSNVPSTEGITDTPIFLIQVTRFACGGFSVGARFNHTMVDGTGLVLFLKAISELAQGATTPSTLPVWERELLMARPNPIVTYKHDLYDEPKFEIMNNLNIFDVEWLGTLMFNTEKIVSDPLYMFFPKFLKMFMTQSTVIFGPKEIKALRNQVKEPCTTFELIGACVWKCRTIAHFTSSNATVRITFPINIRGKSFNGKEFPRGYYGNAIIHVSAAVTAKLLCERPLSFAVQLIKEAKNTLNTDYIKSLVDFMAIKGMPRLPGERNIVISNLSRLGMDTIDFGWGNLIHADLGTAVYGVSPIEHLNTANTTESSVLFPLALPHISMLIFKYQFKKMTS